ncbi:hypothetical protein AMTR_s04508p00006750, partial [Amborella trichopoda]
DETRKERIGEAREWKDKGKEGKGTGTTTEPNRQSNARDTAKQSKVEAIAERNRKSRKRAEH